MEDSTIPIRPMPKKAECSYCGMHNHNTHECHYHLMNTAARDGRDMNLLEELAGLEREALRRGLMMREMPRAVSILAAFGTSYGKDGETPEENRL